MGRAKESVKRGHGEGETRRVHSSTHLWMRSELGPPLHATGGGLGVVFACPSDETVREDGRSVRVVINRLYNKKKCGWVGGWMEI